MTSTAMGPKSPKRATSSLEGPDNSLPSQKRQRVYVACDHCRLRKQKCDSKRPACSTCLASGVTCVYGAGVKKRGLPPGYVRVLETLYGLIFSRIKNSEETVAALLLRSRVVTRQWALGKHEDSVDEVLQKYKKSSVYKIIERLLESEPKLADEVPVVTRPVAPDQLDWEIDHDNSLQNHDIGGRTGATPIDDMSPDRVMDQRAGPSRMPTVSDTFSNYEGEAEQAVLLSRELRLNFILELLSESPAWLRALAIDKSLLSLQLPSNTWKLLDIYFTFTNCWLPIIQRQDVLKTAHSYKGEKIRLKLASSPSGDHAALWAVIALASHQARFGYKDHLHQDSSLLDAARTYDIARSLIPSESNQYQIGHVKALLILSLMNCARGHASIAWQLIGSAFRGGVQIGLIKQFSSRSVTALPSLSPLDDNGLLAGCFIVDALISAWAGMPSHFRAGSVADITAVDTDRLEEYEPWFNRTNLNADGAKSSNDHRGPQLSFTIFNQLLQLTKILHGLRGNVDNLPSLEAERVTTAFLQLRRWKGDLPESCQLSPYLGNEEKLQVTPQLLHLHLVYNFMAAQCASMLNAAEDPSIRSRSTPEESTASLLVRYGDLFSPATMPALFRAFTSNLHQVPDSLNLQLQRVVSLFERTWYREEVLVTPVLSSHPLQRLVKRMSDALDYFSPLKSVKDGVSTGPGNVDHTRDASGPLAAAHGSPNNVYNSSIVQPDPVGHDQEVRVTPIQHERNITRRVATGINENQMYSISPMSMDGMFKRPDNPRGYGLNDLDVAQSYQQQVTRPHVSLDALTHGNQLYQQGVYDPRLSSLYEANNPTIEAQRTLGTDFDLDQLFNDLAPLDQTVSQPAFMMNLGISGDLGFDMDTFFARPD